MDMGMGMGMDMGIGMTFENRYECRYSYTRPMLIPTCILLDECILPYWNR